MIKTLLTTIMLTGLFFQSSAQSGYDEIYDFNEGMALVSTNGKWGFIDESAKLVIPLKYDDAYSFIDGLALVVKNNKYGYINKEGVEIVPLKYDWAYRRFMREEVAWVSIGDNYGLVNKEGKEITPIKYQLYGDFLENVEDLLFSEGLVAVHVGDWESGKSGYLDTTGKEALAFIYTRAHQFSNGLASVERDGNGSYSLVTQQPLGGKAQFGGQRFGEME